MIDAAGETHESADDLLGRLEASDNSFEITCRIDCSEVNLRKKTIEVFPVISVFVEEGLR
jgi:hypothetical protein